MLGGEREMGWGWMRGVGGGGRSEVWGGGGMRGVGGGGGRCWGIRC